MSDGLGPWINILKVTIASKNVKPQDMVFTIVNGDIIEETKMTESYEKWVD